MADRRITKIKFKKELITIEWEQYQAKTEDWDKFSLTSKDEPLPSFPEAMAALAKDVEVICELPEGDAMDELLDEIFELKSAGLLVRVSDDEKG